MWILHRVEDVVVQGANEAFRVLTSNGKMLASMKYDISMS